MTFFRTHESTMDVLVKAYREGRVRENVLRRFLEDDSKEFNLESSFGTRPDPITSVFRPDVAYIRSVTKGIRKSRNAGKRIQVEWTPERGRILEKRIQDDSAVNWENMTPLNDVCTKWCTRTFFPSSKERLSFISDVFGLYELVSKEEKGAFDLVFKGGVIMRLLMIEFLNNFPLDAHVRLEKYMNEQKALSFSDFDFEIVPKDHSPSQGSVLSMISLNFAVLLWLRKVLDSDKVLTGDVTDDAMQTLRSMLQEAVDHIDAQSPLHGASVDRVVRGCQDPKPPSGYATASGRNTPRRRDNVVIFREDDDTHVMNACDFFTELDVAGVPCDYPRNFYCTMNMFIGEESERERPSQLMSLFHLSRIKQGFVVYMTLRDGKKICDRLGGEILDLSQSNGTHKDEVRRFMYDRVKQPYRTYYVIGSSFHIRSYSANGLLHDLMMQVHFQEQPPFAELGTSRKLNKRLLRYAMFLIIYVMGPFCEHPYKTKVRALTALLNATASLESLTKRHRVGVAAVDTFLSNEQHTLAMPGPVKQKRAYVSAVHKHVSMVVSLITSPRASGMLMDARYLEYADTFLY